ncbi:MAG: zinc-dependent alcohol dehydrogenase family protein [Pseudomonadota bacterium]|jgi:propanol-preferring alcohol dehydrogenase
MRAMILEKPALISALPLRMTDLPEPLPGPAEIVVKVAACGICRTDLHIVEGDLEAPMLPLVPGHQVIGNVVAAGSGVTRFKHGDRVGIAWLHHTCGTCRFCTTGRENLCPRALFTGFNSNGGYAEFTAADQEFAYSLDKGLTDTEAAPLLCAGIIGFRALKLSGIEAGGRLGLYGFGASAHIAIQVARHAGAEVYVFSRSPEHRKLAEDLGAVWSGAVPEDPPQRLDASIIFAPAGELVPPALEVLDRGGKLVLAGIHMSDVPSLNYNRHLYYEKILRSVASNTRDDGEEFLKLAASIPVRTKVETYELREANRALLDLKKGKIDGAGVLIP